MNAVLYITYDGLLEPLGQSQVLAYLAHLASDHKVHVLSFEKQKDRRNALAVAGLRARLDALGIGWTPLRYHKTPSAPATAYDVVAGSIVAFYLALRLRAAILHARSYVPTLMALPSRRFTRAKLLFDMRGFWADERVDGGLWPRDGALYRITKTLERRFLRAADHIVTLTSASVRELRAFDGLQGRSTPITVIPTCTDLTKFCRHDAQATSPFVFGYVGSIGTWYLFDETMRFFRRLLDRRPDAKFLVVNRNEHDVVRAVARKAGVPYTSVEVVAASHDEVPDLVRRMHLGSALIKPSFSKIASAPTKLAEYLGCGVPCLGNEGVGDVAEILQTGHVGVVMRTFTDADIDLAVDQALRLCEDRNLPARCVGVARELFSLGRGVAEYRRIYESLAS